MSTVQEKQSLSQILEKAGKRALGGGIPGAMAMTVQVGSLMWVRTTMNYQYRHGTSTFQAMKTLYAQGGIPRFYQGVLPALFQGPLSRFGDTACNAGTLALLDSYDSTKGLPIAVKTAFASFAAGLWRINLTPIDTIKTIMQVEGKNGLPALRAKFKARGVPVFYHGAIASMGATMVGHYPWFVTYNYLDSMLPVPEVTWKKLSRNAMIGFCASFVSDVTSNSIRVTKVTKQTHTTPISYPQAVKMIVQADGLKGLFFRGLGTRLLANGLNGMLFTVVWKSLQESLFPKQ